MVVLDSLRYDSGDVGRHDQPRAARPIERRWSYASWTAPSHYNLLMGLLPHTSPSHVYASEYYKRDIPYAERLGVPGVEFKKRAAIAVPPHVPAVGRVPHIGARLDAGAQPPHADQPRLRRVRVDGKAQ